MIYSFPVATEMCNFLNTMDHSEQFEQFINYKRDIVGAGKQEVLLYGGCVRLWNALNKAYSPILLPKLPIYFFTHFNTSWSHSQQKKEEKLQKKKKKKLSSLMWHPFPFFEVHFLISKENLPY